MSKIGVHVVIGPRNGFGDFLREIADAGQTLAVVKCVDDFGAALEAKQKLGGNVLTVARLNGVAGRDMQAWEPRDWSSAQEAAQEYYSLVRPTWLLNPHIDAWETFNEFSAYWAWQGEFYIAMMDLAEVDGFKLVLYAFSSGNPPGLPDDLSAALECVPALREAKRRGHYLSSHEYGGVSMPVNTLRGTQPYHALRYRRLYQDMLIPNAADAPLIISECGQSAGYDFIGAHIFIEDLAWYDAELMKDSYVVGAAAWTLGSWVNANFQDALPAMAEYIVTHPNLVEPPLPSLEVIALNRLAFGPRPGDLETFRALGPTDDARLQAYVDQQLNPAAIDDSACDARIAAADLPSLNMTLPQLWSNYYRAEGADQKKPAKDVRAATLIRAVYSQRQLLEVLVDFWRNHFNVYAWDDSYASSTWAHYDRDVIRAHALGNFRQMLEAVATSTAMLYYLDNYVNQDGGPNENYARELFELHTLGAENYLGVGDQNAVPGYPNNPIGYVDDDVYEATRCFTGWRVNDGSSSAPRDDGTFLYYEAWHDRFQKTVLGKYIQEHQPAMKDGRDVLDTLAAHPGTARFICRKLCRRLIGDDPPQSVVDAAAAVFTAQQNAPDQLKQVVRAIALSPEFRTTWGQKIKRPFEAAVSMLRAVNAEFGLPPDENFQHYYSRMGQPLFERRTPDGYPDVRTAWANTTSLLYRWRFCYYMINGSIRGTRVDVASQMPAGLTTPNAIADYWIDRLLGRLMGTQSRTEVVNFLAQGADPSIGLTGSQIAERLPRLVELILMSPDFQWR
ncbi:MAG TPA: DUF1800 domain-containing protein [Anaerolineae bacterium]|nr:DUF1800 domain-containing protein [Anaerolineae bacterium]